MNIATWNVNGIRAILKKEFMNSVEELSADIICLQETKAQTDEVEKALAGLSSFNIYSNAADQKGYSGTVILSKTKPLNVTYDMGIEEHDREGRIICAEYPDFYVVNVYVPNSGRGLVRLDYRQKWDADFLSYLKNLNKTKPVIACGDFNVAHRAIDLKNDKSNYNKTAGYTQIEIDGMDNFLNEGFVDSFRELYPDEVAYTYWSYRFNSRAKNTGWRLDYFLIPHNFFDHIKDVKIHNDIMGSDHCPVSLQLNTKKT
ncbi:exodeoxyribonuclease III [Zhouia amylolytica]|uniref:Exodeoxyribonuclease iii xth n=1 Tax=Zhouia amylolytica AD3 TaxID=1286632 RepID=W2UP10_9FLAO|nr:exodeoxyribonuclease III [Zhouia amylolytica]ETN95895.1 exodeoxyribonuclease iii xth [Zhouia amylolytica AD3]